MQRTETLPAAKRIAVQREAQEQAALFRWAALNARSHPGLDLMFAIPNGAYLQGGSAQRAAQWARLKKQGARKGVHDVFLPVPMGEKHGLWIEMKAPKPHSADVTEDQAEWLERMVDQGYAAHVAYGWTEAVDIINLYYGREK